MKKQITKCSLNYLFVELPCCMLRMQQEENTGKDTELTKSLDVGVSHKKQLNAQKDFTGFGTHWSKLGTWEQFLPL